MKKDKITPRLIKLTRQIRRMENVDAEFKLYIVVAFQWSDLFFSSFLY